MVSLLTLSPEIRVIIYEHLFAEACLNAREVALPCQYRNTAAAICWRLELNAALQACNVNPQILHTRRTVYEEASSVLARSLTVIDISRCDSDRLRDAQLVCRNSLTAMPPKCHCVMMRPFQVTARVLPRWLMVRIKTLSFDIGTSGNYGTLPIIDLAPFPALKRLILSNPPIWRLKCHYITGDEQNRIRFGFAKDWVRKKYLNPVDHPGRTFEVCLELVPAVLGHVRRYSNSVDVNLDTGDVLEIKEVVNHICSAWTELPAEIGWDGDLRYWVAARRERCVD